MTNHFEIPLPDEQAQDQSIKKQVQNEILALLDESIEEEITAMKDHYTIAEIAREVLIVGI